jgi:hypothetical protein
MGYLEFVDLLLGDEVRVHEGRRSTPRSNTPDLRTARAPDAKHESLWALVALAPRLWRADRDRHAPRRRGRRSGGASGGG